MSNTKRLTLSALFCALTAVGAFLRVPLPYLDYCTMQTFFVLMSALILGPRDGAAAMAVYMAAGLIGFPVFAAGGGLGYALKPTFGYILGFIPEALAVGYASKKLKFKPFLNDLIACLAGIAVCYALGMTYKYLILNFFLNEPVPFFAVVFSALPFILPSDLISAVCVSLIAGRLRAALKTR